MKHITMCTEQIRMRRPVGRTLQGIVVYLTVACIFVLAAPLVAAVLPEGTLHIAMMGDSITQANSEHLGYRYRLWAKLIDANIDFDLVGSMDSNWQGNPTFPSYNGETYDQDHEGHWGWRADQILTGIPSSWIDSEKLPLADRLALYDHAPDIVLLHIGSNDMFAEQSASSTYTEIGQIIDGIRDTNPNVAFVLAKILPSSKSARNNRIVAFNSELADFAATKVQLDSPIVIVDQYDGFNPNYWESDTHSYDGTHPNGIGEELMAQKWFAGINSLLAAEPTPSDFDSDGDVDGSDFLAWQRGFGDSYDATDLVNWENEYGSTAAVSAANTVPEPASAFLLAAGAILVASRMRWGNK